MVLAIECSSPQGSLALWDTDAKTIVWSSQFVTVRSHNSVIFDHLKEALSIATPEAIHQIVVGVGPGSYGGVRVAIAAANGFGIALGSRVIGVSSLEAYSPEESDYLVCGDARRSTYFLAEIKNRKLVDEPKLIDSEEFEKCLDRDLPTYTMDEGLVEKYPHIEHRYPSAEGLARLCDKLSKEESEEMKPIEPHYLRPPYITKAKKKPVPGFPT